MNNDLLKNQHNTIRQLIQEIEEEVRSGNLDQKAFDLSLKISKLSGILVLHLKSEDEYLYPALKNSKDGVLSKTAEQLYREMGSLSTEFLSYKSTYMSAAKIKADIPQFIGESNKIFSALKNRLNTEDKRLYQHI
ncbi:hemerythrin HHE cation binding domain-containing protein [Desulfitobacterium sp. LBE]|uniref:hemerythrin domain-containing protein n=1 Tax=Desulfitobacterium sp. LBE TaxID=884086 RepID=UPI00119C3B40|nr:hemerythrin domain-containing protein [Desulfitobacterium sp. LBE]TWH58043.1 hemerythrin HHE cation binding domain-containing protein [Desulfitobacterium sp. LBE]